MAEDRQSDSRVREVAQRLVDSIRPLDGCAVAFSGGVDSAVVAQAARLALRDRAFAVTGVSASLADGESNAARRIAAQIGIRHRLIETQEIGLDAYRRNDGRRCFHCKSELYHEISRLRSTESFEAILSGTNKDDENDYRPGLEAATAYQVRHPLAECGIDKSTVRSLARWWGIEIWDKPASPCLSSRIAYGVEVTVDRLRRVDCAEAFLKSRGYGPLRVRLHDGELARIELPSDQIERMTRDTERIAVAEALLGLGFRFVSLDLLGLRSGGLNDLLRLESLPPPTNEDKSQIAAEPNQLEQIRSTFIS